LKSDADSALLAILEHLRNNDEDCHPRKKISRTLTDAQVKKYRAMIRKNKDESLFPVDRFYVRTDRRTGKHYLIRSRRIGSFRGRKKSLVPAGSII